MKKLFLALIALLLVAGIAIGIYFWVRPSKDNPGNVTYKVDLIESKYTVGDKIIFRASATADVQLTSMTYTLNNGSETEISVKAGESEDADEVVGKGKYYINTGAQIIETAEFTPGYYTLVIYAYDADETRYIITSEPIVFELSATKSA